MTALQKTMRHFDDEAARSGNAPAFWASASLLLAIWSSSGIPSAGYGPQAAVDLFDAFKRHGRDLRIAVDARVFPV